MAKQQRILSIDIMRGLTLFLMLFVNDLYADGVPVWLTHRPADYDGMGLADWVFPGFLFMVGMAVPFAIQSRMKKGDNTLNLVVPKLSDIQNWGVLLISGCIFSLHFQENSKLEELIRICFAI